VPGLTADAFSVRWDGCLTIPEARAGGAGSEAGSDASSAAGGRELRFRLRSDDDARVWLGKRSLLRAWNPRGPSEQSSVVPLAPGTYAIRVEYRDIRGPALISLAIEDISREIEDDPRSSPDAWLTPPPKPFRASDPCGLAAREESE
jgi:hypothetical protein